MTCYGFLFVFSCAAPTLPAAAVPYCQVAQPVTWSAADTRETKVGADRENRKYKRLCMGAAAGAAK